MHITEEDWLSRNIYVKILSPVGLGVSKGLVYKFFFSFDVFIYSSSREQIQSTQILGSRSISLSICTVNLTLPLDPPWLTWN